MPKSVQSGTGTGATCAEPATAADTHRLSGLTIFNHWDGGRLVVSVRGDLHLEEDERLNSALRPLLLASDGSIDLELSRVDCCGCSAVNVLLHVDPSAAAPPAEPADEPDADLSREVAQLRRAMQSRGTIDMARGVLVAAFGLSPQNAWEALVDVSQRTNIKLHRVAQHLVDSTTGAAPLPKPVQSQLSAVIARLPGQGSQADQGFREGSQDPAGPVDGQDWDWGDGAGPAPAGVSAAVPSPSGDTGRTETQDL